MFEKSKRSIRAATSGGTYRVRDSSTMQDSSNLNENSRKSLHISRLGTSQKAKNLAITVIFLDDSQHTFEVEKSAKGAVLLEKVFQHLELIERDYFGLQFDELLPPPEVISPLSSPHLRWIESSKQLKKQIRFNKPTVSRSSSKKSSIASNSSIGNGGEITNTNTNGNPRNPQKKLPVSSQPLPSATVYFRVKFFVEDPARLNEEYTRYHVFLQLRKDILEGRLVVTPSTACLLASYAVQSELGDFNPEEHDEANGYYLKNTEANLLLLKGEDYLRKIAQLHKLHKGQTPADAEFNYLSHAKRLEAYGVSFHRVKDNMGKEIEVGVSSMGISVYHNGIKINTFSWSKITKIAFKRKHFFIQLRRELSEEYDTLLLFDCWSYRSCKRLWKCCVEHHAFFRLSAPPPPNRRPTLLLLALGSRFRYSGRTEYQTREDASSRSQSRERERERRTFFRSPSKKLLFLRQTISGNKGSSKGHGDDIHDNGHDRDRDRERDTIRKEREFKDRISQVLDRDSNKENVDICPSASASSSQYYSHSQGQPHTTALQLQQLQQHQPHGVGMPSNGIVRDSINLSASSVAANRNSAVTSLRAYDKVHQSSSEKEPRQAWAEQNLSDDEGGFLDRTGIILPPASSGSSSVTPAASNPVHISLLGKGIAFADDDDNSQSDDGTVSIRLEPDNQAKFGFNVKGGCDMGCPVLVSRVAPGTPADQGYPRLNEGDQLIQINGKDTSAMMHREIVNSIRHAATVRKELILRVRQNVYSTEDFEEPAFQYVPDVPFLHMVPDMEEPGVQTALASSMLLLAEALESDSISSQFELVFRRKPGMSCDVAKVVDNITKNRYRDILPYDSTRVILNSSPNGDYINANYVTMEIPASGIVNRYIATQGPLSSTSVDFWAMVWETQSPLIVMLTPICEHGRIKCHPYWPQNLNSSVVYHNLQVTTIQEKNLPQWTHREFQIKNLQTDEERVVVQLLYQSWPDHGVPDEPVSFIRFIEEVRKARVGTVEPTIVHCSAGIGRTGVLILMETAECLIEANQPVYPLDIVTQMRLQRPLMIQTPSQYKFVCECVLRVYQKGMIRPLPEFSVPGNSPPSQLTTSALGAKARAFCSSWFHNNIQQQLQQSGSSNA